MAQPLILCRRFVPDGEDRFIPGHAYPFQNGNLARHREEIPDGNEWIFEVIQKSKTKDNVELSEGLNPGIFRIYNTELQVGGTASGFVHIFLPAIERKHIETKIAQKNSKMAQPTTDIYGSTQLKVLLQGLE